MRMLSGPPARQGKEQIIAYLPPNQIAAVRQKADREGKTFEELIAEAVNAVCDKHGMPPLLETGHRRIVRRHNSRAKERNSEKTPSCRRGKMPIGGYFEIESKNRVHQFASEINLKVQGIIQYGVFLLTGVGPLPRQVDETEARAAA